MTRDSIPRDDLYGELEVSRQASVAAIEAAYRRLVKQHHPDVVRSDDLERIKRLNLAREWLTDLDRRRRYDVSRGMSPTSAIAHHSPNGDDAPSGTRRRPGTPGPAPNATSEPARSFGVNANEVRIFLASLRGLDSERARRVFDGRAVAHAQGYAGARRLATQIGQVNRKTEWQLAREAASVIARGKLGDTTLTEQVVDVLADTAGAIAIRDLLSKTDYKTMLLPWTWKSARVAPAEAVAPRARTTKAEPSSAAKQAAAAAPIMAPARVAAPTAAAAAAREATAAPSVAATGAAPAASAVRGARAEPAAAPAHQEPSTRRASISDLGASPWPRPRQHSPGPRQPIAPRSRPGPADSIPAVSMPSVSLPALNQPRVRVPSWLPDAVVFGVFVVVAGALLGIGRPPPDQAVAGMTDAPTSGTSGGATAGVAPGTSVAAATADPGSSDPGGETPGSEATEPPGGPGGGATQPPDPTPRPTRPPPPAPTPTPAAPPTQTPPPTPTPEPECTVPDLIGGTASQATGTWAAAGFTGSVISDPPMQPNQRIGWQSLVAGSSELCSSGITVRKVA